MSEPTVGTPAWCLLAEGDSCKLAAVYDAAQHWALRVEYFQQAYAGRPRRSSEAADWPTISRHIRDEREFYAARPWLKRVI